MPLCSRSELARAGEGRSFSAAVTALFGVEAVPDSTTRLTLDDLRA
jgi:hypothetical protein